MTKACPRRIDLHFDNVVGDSSVGPVALGYGLECKTVKLPGWQEPRMGERMILALAGRIGFGASIFLLETRTKNNSILSVRQYQIGRFFSDHQGGCRGVAPNDLGHDRQVRDPERFDSIHSELGVGHGFVVCPHTT